MDAREARLKFSESFERFRGKTKELGLLAYNLLHDPERDKKLKAVQIEIDNLLKHGQEFDKVTKGKSATIETAKTKEK